MSLRSLACAIALTLPSLALALPDGPVTGVQWDGFGSAYLAKPLTKHARPTIINDPSVDTTGMSLLGLNLRALVNTDVVASAQLVAKIRDEDRGYLNAKWFYLTWTPQTDLHLKAGRQVYPLFINSEVADVHAALPYTRIPDEITAMAPFLAFDGVSADHTYRLSPTLRLTVILEGGRAIFAPGDEAQRYGHDLAGINLGMTGGWWTVAAHASRLGFTPSSMQPEGNLANYTGGIKLEPGPVLAQVEGIHQETDKGNGDGGYALIGYKWSNWMVRYSYNWARAKALIQGETQTRDFGVNYQIGQRLVAKFDSQVSSFSDERGGIGITRETKKVNALAALVGLDFTF